MGIYYGNSFGSGGGYKPPSYSYGSYAQLASSVPETYAGGVGLSNFYGGMYGGQPPAQPTIPTYDSSASGGQPTPAAQSTPQKPTLPDLSNLNFANDPILMRIQGLTQQQNASSDAATLAARRQLVIGYGDPALAKTLGLGNDVGKQAGGNTFGTLQELQRGYGRRNVFDINRPLSDQANLFYSSERARQLGLSGEQYLRDQNSAQAAVQAQLQQIAQQNVQAKLDAQNQLIQAEQDAYQRAIQQAMFAAGAA